MKKILYSFVLALTAIAFTQCAPETPVKPEKFLSASLKQESAVLPYSTPTRVEYTLSDAKGKVTVEMKGLPSEIGFTNTFTGEASGYIELTSTLDENKEIDTKVTFKDQKTSVSKDLKIQTTKKEIPFSVTVENPVVSLTYGQKSETGYDAVGLKGDLTVNFKNVPEGITMSKVFDKTSGKGKLTFETTLTTETEKKAVIVFSDGNSTQETEFTFSTGTWSVAPSEPVVQLESEIIYPAEYNINLKIPFTIACQTSVDEVTVETGAVLDASLELASDKKSGTITVKAKPELGSNANVILKAKNAAGESSKSFSLVKAFLDIDHESYNVAAKGTSTQYSLNISTNLATSIEVSENFVKASQNGNVVAFTVEENTTMTMRTATITVKEPKNKMNKSVLITQAGTEGDNASDRAALIALYNALNMKEWTECGAFGTYYSNWNTNETMDKWLGVELTGYNGEGRVWSISLVGEQPNSTGYIPEELGQLTKLSEFSIYPGHKISHLPECIKNLISLKRISFNGDIIDMDLSSWTGLAELMNNPNHKLDELCFANTGLHGTIPEWLSSLSYDGAFEISGCHFSGQVPEKVAKAGFWSKKYMYNASALEACPRFDKTKYNKSEDGWYYEVPQGEAMMYLQADNYALWVGERPSNTKWVDDKFGGHWEWK